MVRCVVRALFGTIAGRVICATCALLGYSAWTFEGFDTSAADWERVNNVPKAPQCEGDTCAPKESWEDSPILCVGVSKTGTTSLKKALDLLGYNTIHWIGWLENFFEMLSYFYQGKIKHADVRKAFKGLPAKSAFLDCPTAAIFDEMRAAYPASKVIMTVRNPEAWMRSYQGYTAAAWLYHYTACPGMLALCYFSRALRLGSILRALGFMPAERTGFDLELLPQMIQVYQLSDKVLYGSAEPNFLWQSARQRIEDHIVASVPKDQLLTLDITGGEGWEKLLPFLGYPEGTRESMGLPRKFPKEYTKSDLAVVGGHNYWMFVNKVHIIVGSMLMALFSLVLFVVIPLATSAELRARARELFSHVKAKVQRVGSSSDSASETSLRVGSILTNCNELQIQGRTDIIGADSKLFPRAIRARADFPVLLEVPDEVQGHELSPALVSDVHKHIKDGLDRHGALVLRGLPMQSAEDMSAFIESLGALEWEPQVFGGGGTYRTQLTKDVRTSSDEPPAQTMEPHMDKAHCAEYPDYVVLMMHTAVPHGAGGEMILTDMRAVTADLEASGVTEFFENNGGVRYKKFFPSSDHANESMRGFTWQHAFDVSDKVAVEAQLKSLGATWDWKDQDVLEVDQVEPAVRTHRSTGERLWFNGAHTNHASYYMHAAHIDTSEGPPMSTEMGNGEFLPLETLERIRASFWQHSVPVRLREGDLVIVDNMLVAHGRMSWPDRLPRNELLTHIRCRRPLQAEAPH